MGRYVYRISKDGLTIQGLWNDFLSNLGDLQVFRASEVEFDNTSQQWTVTITLPGIEAYSIGKYSSRNEALNAEREHLNKLIADGSIGSKIDG